MMKRIMSLALALLMLVSLFPATVLASGEPEVIITPAGGEAALPTGETEETPCATCGNVGCASLHENWCALCKVDDCGIDHSAQQPEPPAAPTAACEVCGNEPCTCESVACEICGNEPCTCESVACEICGNEPCTCESAACEICGNEPCTCEPTAACEICGNEPCTCESAACEICGNEPCICEEGEEDPAEPTGEEEPTEPEVHPMVGKTAKITSVFPVLWKDPTNNDPALQVSPLGGALPAYVKIVDVYVYSETLTLYKLDAADGYTWPAECAEHRYMESSKLTIVEPCPFCKEFECASEHFNWCPECEMDDCGIDHTKPENPCACCENCTGEEGCECACEECEFCKVENSCACCEECTGDDECDCQCGECDFCVKLVQGTVSASVNGQAVTVSGMLPEGAKLTAYEAISGLDGGFAYDIKILDADGNEWQPANGEKVSLSIPVSGVGDGTTIQIVHALEDADAIRQTAASGRVLSEAWAISSFPAAAAAYAEVIGGSGVAVEILTPTVYGGVATVSVAGFSIYTWNGSSFQQTDTGDTLKIVYHATLTQGDASGTRYVTAGQTIRCDRGGKIVNDREWQTSADGTYFYYNTDHVAITKTEGGNMDNSGSGANIEFTVDSNAPAGTTFWIRCRIYHETGFFNYQWSHWVNIKYVIVDEWTINFYNGSSKISSDTIVTGSGTLHDPISWPSDPTKSGYTFRGWSTANTGTSVINKSSWYPVQPTTNLYAVFTYDVAYSLNGGSGTSTTQRVNSNDNVTLHSAPTKTGYSFDGWKSSADGVTYNGGGTYSAKKSTTMTAQWNANNYTYNVKYVSSTGESLGGTTVTKAFGGTYTVTPPAITGYTAPAAQSVAWDSTSAKTITFTYTLNTYKISYNLDGGTVATANPTSYNVNTASFTLRNPVKTGYTFAGWTGTGITGASTSVTIAKGSTGDRSYTATYTPNIYHVTLDKNGGSGGTDEYWYKYKTTVEHGQPNTDDGGLAYYYTDANCSNYMINGTAGDRYFHVNIPSRYGYTFEGYYLGDVQYVDENGTCVNNIYDNVAADSTLVAKWTAITDAWYTVYYKWQEGEGETYKEGSILDNKHVPDLSYGVVVTETAPTLTGYTLVSEPTFDMVAGYSGDTGTVHTFYYTRNNYSLNFDYNGGHQDIEDHHGESNPTTATLTMTYGSDHYTSVGVLYPHREGYTFLGWYTAKTGGEQVFGANNEHVNGTYWKNDKWSYAGNDLTLYAQWSVNTYTVKFHGNGSTAGSMADQVFEYGEEKALTAEGFTRNYAVNFAKYNDNASHVIANAKFLGWAASADGEVVYTNGQSVKNLSDADGAVIDLYAVWELESVTLPNVDERAGYTFDGWRLQGGDLYQPGCTFTPTAYTQFEQEWTPVSYTATFVYGGSQPNSTDIFTVNEGVELPVLTRTGYTYKWKVTSAAGNWTIGDGYTGAAVSAGKYGNVTFTLVWTPKTDAEYIVHYYREGTTEELETSKTIVNQTYGSNHTENAITITGYTLVSSDPQTVTAGYDNNEIIFYYKPIVYTVTWLNDDDSLIDTTSVAYGETPTHADPSKEATAEYTYTFSGWTPAITAVTGEATYKATYTATKNRYTVTFVNYDGTELLTAEYEYGTPAADIKEPAEPSKPATAQYTYTFDKWSPEIADVTGNATYTATYSSTVNQYTVTVSGEHGTYNEYTVDYGGEASTWFWTDKGYRITGYQLDGGTVTTVSSDKMVGNNLILRPIYRDRQLVYFTEPFEYTITYSNVYSTTGDATTYTDTYNIEENLTLLGEPTRDGYRFVGWELVSKQYESNWEDGQYSSAQNIGTGKHGDITMNAVWEAVEYSITYDLDGGELPEGKSNPATYTIESSSFTLANPTKVGYTFAGWTGTGLDAATQTVTVAKGSTGDREYTAKWTPIEYEVKWYGYQGIYLTSTKVPYGEMPVAPTNVDLADRISAEFTEKFIGWDREFEIVTGDTSYTAKYDKTRNWYYVSFVDEDGVTVLKEAKLYEYGTPADKIEKPEDPEKEATAQYTYTFAGWNPTIDDVKGTVTYTATYTATVNQYTLSGEWETLEHGRNIFPSASETYMYGEEASITFSVKPGYTITGTTQNGWYRANDSIVTSSGHGFPSGLDEDIHIVAHTALIPYTITYDFNYPNSTEAITTTADFDVEETVTLAEAPSVDGYKFVGWKTEATHHSEKCSWRSGVYEAEQDFGTGNFGDVTFVAQWEVVEYSITYELDEGALAEGVTNPAKYTVETETFTLNNPVKAGYEFIGWAETADAESGSKSVTVEKGTTGNKTFYAIWKRSLVDLTISTASTDANQSFIFTVDGTRSDGVEFKPIEVVLVGTDSITIKDMPVGEYTVTEKDGWSWRQNGGGSQSADLRDEGRTVTFSFGVDRHYWLSGCSYYGRRKGGNG